MQRVQLRTKENVNRIRVCQKFLGDLRNVEKDHPIIRKLIRLSFSLFKDQVSRQDLKPGQSKQEVVLLSKLSLRLVFLYEVKNGAIYIQDVEIPIGGGPDRGIRSDSSTGSRGRSFLSAEGKAVELFCIGTSSSAIGKKKR